MTDERVNPLKRRKITESPDKQMVGTETLDDFKPLAKAIEIPESVTIAAAAGTKFERRAAPKSTRTKFKTNRTIVQRVKVSQKTQDEFRALSDLVGEPFAVVFEQAISQMLKRERKKRINV